MSPKALDFLYIKTIEKQIGRRLDEIDIETIRYGEQLFAQKTNGVWASYFVPVYKFPHDLMVKDADLAASSERVDIFNYAFNEAVIKVG